MDKSGSDSKKVANNPKSSSRKAESKLDLEDISFNLIQSEPEAIANLPRPPFPHLLLSNIPPTESEASLVRDAIIIAYAEESRLKEMAATHLTELHPVTSKALTKLNCEICRTRQFIIEHEAILSTIRRIPIDILEDIFVHTLPTLGFPVSEPSNVYFAFSERPWALSHVCQLWRMIAVSCSIMWKDLPDIMLDKAHTRKKPYLDYLTETLKRSCNRPIRFAIRGFILDIPHPVIEMLVLESDRWQAVHITGSLALMYALQRIKGRLSSLQSLDLNLSKEYLMDPTVHELFRIAPQLRHICNYTRSDFIFPSHQLVNYVQYGGPISNFIRVISSSPDLRILELDDEDDGDRDMGMLRPYTLPHLTTFHATGTMSFTFHEQFLSNITLPAMEELRLDTYLEGAHGDENSILPVYSMILRSSSPSLLRILHLGLNGNPGDLSSLLKLTPLLTSLTVKLPPVDDISALIFDGNTAPLVPLLEECKFLPSHDSDDSPPTETIQALKLLASSRCELHDDPMFLDILQLGKFHRLKNFGVRFHSWAHVYVRDFEEWAYSHMADELSRQSKCLLTMIPEISHRNFHVPSSREFDLTWKGRVIGMLTHLETLKVEKVADIRVSVHSVFVFHKPLSPY